MLKKKLKKHGFADRLKYMRLLESGRSFTSINKEFGINKGHYNKTAAKVVLFSELFAFLQRKMCKVYLLQYQ